MEWEIAKKQVVQWILDNTQISLWKLPITDNDGAEMEIFPYGESIGQLLYISTWTRPDISVALGVLTPHVAYSRPVHWTGVKRFLRYIKGTIDYRWVLNLTSSVLLGHADSDWAGSSDRVSITGDITQIGSSTITWKGTQQKCLSISSTEAEYVSLSHIAREITWLRGLL